jgi:Tol biopolymer transport system component
VSPAQGHRSCRGPAGLLLILAAVAVSFVLPIEAAAGAAPPQPGGQILYSCPTTSGGTVLSAICRVNPDGTGATTVVDGIDFCCTEFALSPDGTRLLWVGGEPTEDLTVADADGGTRKILPVNGTISSPAWSPQSDRIAFISTGFQANQAEIDVVDADLQHLRTVLVDPAIAHGGATGPPGSVTWSPDGNQLAFGTIPTGNPNAVPAGTIEVVPAAGGTPSPVVENVAGGAEELSWAPASDLLFTNGHEGVIWEAAPNGVAHPVESLVGGGGLDASPSWGPDGLHFSAVRNGRIVIATLDGGVERTLGPSGITEASWGGGAGSVSPAGTERNAFTQSVLTPGQIGLTLSHVTTNVLLALAVVLVVAFVTEVFNSTFAANYERITRPFSRIRGRMAAFTARFRQRAVATFAGTMLVVSLLYCFLDPTFGFNQPSVALFVGMVAGLVLVTLTFDAVAVWHQRRRHRVWPKFRPYLAGIPIAAACVVVSRAAHFLPGYLLGAIAGFTLALTLSRVEEGRLAARSAVWMLVVSLVAWVGRTPVVHAEAQHAALGLQILDSTLTAVVVAGVEGVAFGLIPIRFLEGEKVMAWSRRGWFAIFGAGVLAFVFILVDPTGSFVGKTSVGPVWSMVALLGAFSLVTAAFWAYFRWRPAAPHEPPAWGPGAVSRRD